MPRAEQVPKVAPAASKEEEILKVSSNLLEMSCVRFLTETQKEVAVVKRTVAESINVDRRVIAEKIETGVESDPQAPSL